MAYDPSVQSRGRWLFWAALVIGGILIAGRLIHLTPDFDEKGDGAALSLYTLQALRTRVLVGPYSQYDWNHPGPLLFYVLAPLYYVSGYHEMSLRWTALTINVASIAAMILLARRHATKWLAPAIALTAFVFIWRVGGDFAFSAWNPHIIVLPLGLLVCVCSAIATGTISLLPLAAFLASLIAQSNVAGVPAASVVFLAGVIGALYRWRQLPAADRTRGISTFNKTAWLMALLWFGPLADEVVRHPWGNLGQVEQFFAQSSATHQSIGATAQYFGHYFLGPLAWTVKNAVGWRASADVPLWEPLAAALILGMLGVLAWRTRRTQPFESLLATITVAASVVAAYATYRIPITVGDYQIFWISSLGCVGLALCTAAILKGMAARLPLGAATPTVAAVALVAITTSLCFVRLGQWQRVASDGRPLRDLHDDLAAYLGRPPMGRPVVAHTDNTWGEVAGLVLEFTKRDEKIAVHDDLVRIVGERTRANNTDKHHFLLYDTTQDKPPVGAVPISHRGRWILVETR
jgi:hypothetical protein